MSEPLLSLDQGKNAIGQQNLTTEQLVTLTEMVAAAPAVIEDICGPVEYREVVISRPGGRVGVVLPFKVAEVIGVTVNGSPVADFWSAGAIVTAGSQSSPGSWAAGPVEITAMVGYEVIPAHIRLAARALVRHWWQVGEQGARPSSWGNEPSDTPFEPSGFAVPKRVIELLAPTPREAGFA